MVGQSDVGVNDGVVEIFDVGYGRAVRLCPSNHKHHVGDFGCSVVYFDLGFGNGFCRTDTGKGHGFAVCVKIQVVSQLAEFCLVDFADGGNLFAMIGSFFVKNSLLNNRPFANDFRLPETPFIVFR